MTKKSTIINDTRKSLDKEINKYWSIIINENIVEKGKTRNYDLKEVLKTIEKLADERIQNKLDSITINLGFTSRDQFPKESIYPTIYTLSEKNEMFTRLGCIKTIDTKLKTKLGKKKLYFTEELTSDYITKLKNNLQLEINALRKKLDEFNATHELDVSSAYMMLAA